MVGSVGTASAIAGARRESASDKRESVSGRGKAQAVLLVGERGVGKTSLIFGARGAIFSEKYLPTVSCTKHHLRAVPPTWSQDKQPYSPTSISIVARTVKDLHKLVVDEHKRSDSASAHGHGGSPEKEISNRFNLEKPQMLELWDVPIWSLAIDGSQFCDKAVLIFVVSCANVESVNQIQNHWIHVARYYRSARTRFLLVGTHSDRASPEELAHVRDWMEFTGLPYVIGSNFVQNYMESLDATKSPHLVEWSDPFAPSFSQQVFGKMVLELLNEPVVKEENLPPLLRALPHFQIPWKVQSPHKVEEGASGDPLRQAAGTSSGDVPVQPSGSPTSPRTPPGSVKTTSPEDPETDPMDKIIGKAGPDTQEYYPRAPKPKIKRSLGTQIKEFFQRIIDSKAFDLFIVSLILLCCCGFILEDPLIAGKYPVINEWLEFFDMIFAIIFAAEAVFRILAVGGFRNYIANGWNQIDFICVVASLYSLLSPGESVAVNNLRIVRVLRPLRTVNKFPSLKMVVNCLLGSLPMCVRVLQLCLFFLLIFGLIGVQCFGGGLRARCMHLETGEFDEERVCALKTEECIGDACLCPEFFECRLYGENPLAGYVGFDNIGLAVLTILVLISIEAWGDTMYLVGDAMGWPSNLYFCVVVFVGGMFLLNMVIAVVYVSWTKQQAHIVNEKEHQRKAYVLTALLEQSNVANKIQAKEGEEGRSLRQSIYATLQEKKNIVSFLSLKTSDYQAHNALKDKCEKQLLKEIRTLWKQLDKIDTKVDKETDPADHDKVFRAALQNVRQMEDLLLESRGHLCMMERGIPKESQSRGKTETSMQWTIQYHVWRLTEGAFFQNTMTLVILINTGCMMMEHHDMSEGTSNILALANWGCILVFLAEMVLRLIALGPKKYISDPLLLFDGVVSLLSLAEVLFLDSAAMSVFRLMRIFRLFRLAGAFPKFRETLDNMVKTVTRIYCIGIILALSTFMFSVMGRSIFQNRLDFECEEKPRHHYDNLYWSVITTFQIMTGENWPSVLYDCMRAKGDKDIIAVVGSIFTLMSIVVNMYFILSLFLAVLIDEFTAEDPDIMAENDSEEHTEEGEEEFDDSEIGAEEIAVFGPGFSDAKEQKKPNAIRRCVSKCRHYLRHVVHHKIFETFIMLCILVSFGMMALESPVDDTYSPTKNHTVWRINFYITIIFTAEVVLKILALGLWFGDGAYLKSGWSYLDLAVVAISWAEIIFGEDFPFQFMKSLRAIRALRPLRMAAKIPQLRCCIDAVGAAIPASCQVVVILIVFISMFAICGVQLFAGSYSRCSDDCVLYREDCVGYFDPNLPSSIVSNDKCRPQMDELPSHITFTTHENWGEVHINCSGPAKLITGIAFEGPQQTFGLSVDKQIEPHLITYDSPEYYERPILAGRHTVRLLGSGTWNMRLAGDSHCVFDFSSAGLPETYRRSIDVCPSIADQCTIDRSVHPDWPGAEPRVWYRPPWHFDHYPAAMLTLYEVATLEGWVDIMYRANDVVGPDIGPCRDASPANALFFIIHILVCSFFALNLFVSVVIQKFQDQIKDMHTSHSSGFSIFPDCESPGGDYIGPDGKPKIEKMSLHDAKIECHKLNHEGGQICAGFTYQGAKSTEDTGCFTQALRTRVPGRQKRMIHFKSEVNTYSILDLQEDSKITHKDQRWTCYQQRHIDRSNSFLVQQIRKRFKHLKPARLPTNTVSVFLRVFFAQSRTFDRFITFLIALNIIFLCTDTYGKDAFDDYRDLVDDSLLAIFTFEALIKIFALGFVCYFEDGWNLFDFFIVAASVLAWTADRYLSDFPKEVFVIFKVMRSFRMARVLRRMPGVGPIVIAIMESLASTFYVALLLILCFFIYSLGAIQLFGLIPNGTTLGVNMNFRTFPRAVLTLYYLATGEYWNGLMHDIMVPPACFPIKHGTAPLWENTWQGAAAEIGEWMHATICDDEMMKSGTYDGTCCPHDLWEQKHYSAIPFFLSYMLLSNFILLNVVVGFVLESYVQQVENAEKGLTMMDYEEFLQCWYEFDVAQTGFMHMSLLCPFFNFLRDRPFKTLHAKEHGREVGPGLDLFKESDVVLLSSLHALVLPGDVLQVFHVFIALMYLHHPALLPEAIMDSELLSGYQTLRLESELSLCAAAGFTAREDSQQLIREGSLDFESTSGSIQEKIDETMGLSPTSHATGTDSEGLFGLSTGGMLFTDLVMSVCLLQCLHLRVRLPQKQKEAQAGIRKLKDGSVVSYCPLCPKGSTECNCIVREPKIAHLYHRQFDAAFHMRKETSIRTRAAMKKSQKTEDVRLTKMGVVKLIPALATKREEFRKKWRLDRLDKNQNGIIKDTPLMFWHAQVERANPKYRNAIIDAIIVAQEHEALPHDWNSAFAR